MTPQTLEFLIAGLQWSGKITYKSDRRKTQMKKWGEIKKLIQR
jgi:hypothetical protein|tara:strand:- start:236 stop:364 length:129 start_codon:yes stop_codon:yes gene_type:complete